MSKGYRTTGGTIGRMFDSKQYLLAGQTVTKKEAREGASMLRRKDYLARVVPNDLNPSGNYKWLVYRRAKR